MDLLYVNGVDVFATYGVFLIEEKGLLDPLAQKTSLKHDWREPKWFPVEFQRQNHEGTQIFPEAWNQ